MPVPHTGAVSLPVRVFISYAHGDPKHEDQVRRFWEFLRRQGIDAKLDRSAAEQRQNWPEWVLQQIRAVRFVLVIASPEYRRRAEGEALASEGRGVQWEARLIREEVYADYKAALNRFLPVILPGGSAADIPQWMGPTTTTYYTISDYTLRGAESLLRLLTDQPYETQAPLGSVPVLLPRRAEYSAVSIGHGGMGRDTLLRRLVNRSPRRNEAMVQADIRQLLAAGDLGLDEHDLGAEPDAQIENRRRIDVAASCTVIEVHNDLHEADVLKAAEQQLASYVTARSERAGQRYVAVLTDGVEWHLYHRLDNGLQQVALLIVDSSAPDVEELLMWLESALASGRQIEPTQREILRKLGAGGPSYLLDAAELATIYAKYRDLPTVKVKRRLWAKLLTAALGTNFADDDSLFIDHTLLVAIAKVIGHSVVLGIWPEDPKFNAVTIMSGAWFSDARIGGVGEADFFDWIAEVPGGDRFVKSLVRRLTRFAWENVEHDVMKLLYESIISLQTRHRLGEHYTPDWLAKKIVAECVTDPLAQCVLDASCGSGTFLFHAVRSYLAAAEAAGTSSSDAIRGVVEKVVGVDVHPVAVTLARVTYLLAIGMSRLRADDRPEFSVPVYLGDSLQWGIESDLFSSGGLDIPTDDDMLVNQSDYTGELDFANRLKFPARVVADADCFNRLVTELLDRATRRQRGTAVPPLAAIFRRYAIHDDDRPVLEQTFRIMCELHDHDQDHIWAYYVRNVARPAWLARPENRIDVLIGNPPWLAYRYMTNFQQVHFRAMSIERRLWIGAAVATNQDLSALFVARCIELYLRPGGRFGYVMPWAVLSRRQYEGFRTGYYPVQAQPVRVAFDQPWDLSLIKPRFFKQSPSVIFGRRVNNDSGGAALSQTPAVWSGRLVAATVSHAQEAANIAPTLGEPKLVVRRRSPYAYRFVQGATVVPRFLFLVESDNTNPLGAGAGRRAVRSRRSPSEKKPWKDLGSLHGTVERRFIRPLYLGESILPFRTLSTLEAIVPWDGQRLLHGKAEHLDLYPGLANWWRRAEDFWARNRSSERLDLIEQLDYRKKLSQQFPAADHRVLFNKSGMYLAAAIASDLTAVIDHTLYWGSAVSLDETRFLTAILNSTVLTTAVRSLQSRGEHNPRHYDKYIFQLPIPLYDPADSVHKLLVEHAERSEQVAAGIDLPPVRFEAQRRRIREALVDNGVSADIDAIVKALLA